MSLNSQKISVIIPTMNRLQGVIRCLESILNQTLLPDEIVIVDASDTQELNSYLRRFDNQIRIIYIHTKPDTTRQRNMGVKACSGDIIVFSDDDMIWDKDYLKEILSAFNSYPREKIGAVTGRIMTENGAERKTTIKKLLAFGERVFATIFLLPRDGDGRFQPSGMQTYIPKEVNKLTECEFFYGATMAFRKEVICEFMFDENLRGHPEGSDQDISYRVSRKYQNVYTPYAKIILTDFYPLTSGSRYDLMKARMENYHYIFKKNFPQDPLHRFAFWWSMFGRFLREMITLVVRGRSDGVRGLVSGFINITKG